MSPDTCCSFGIHVDIITIHLCHDRLVSLYIQQQTGDNGDNFVSDTRNMLTGTSGYKWIIQLVSGNISWCKHGISACCVNENVYRELVSLLSF